MDVMIVTPDHLKTRQLYESPDGSRVYIRSAKNRGGLLSVAVKMMIYAPGVPEEIKQLTQCRLHGPDGICVDLDTGVITQR